MNIKEILKLSSKDKLQKLKEGQLEEIKLKLKKLTKIQEAKKGDKGADGITPIKGIHYFDGKTPQKNIDYFDGKRGSLFLGKIKSKKELPNPEDCEIGDFIYIEEQGEIWYIG